jgi:hypothetical protein
MQKMLWVVLALAAGLAVSGCGTPGTPQPPSLNLPELVSDLSASRAGNQVTLTWTTPKRSTDKLLLKGNGTARVCRREGSGAVSRPGNGRLLLAPRAHSRRHCQPRWPRGHRVRCAILSN